MPERRGTTRTAALWLAPSALGILTFFVVPLLFTLWLATQRWDLVSPPVWALTDNVQSLAEARTMRALVTTSGIGACAVFLQICIGFLSAALYTRLVPRSSLVPTLLLVPWLTAPLAVGTLARWLLAPADGVLARLFGVRFTALEDPTIAPALVAVAVAWQTTGVVALLYAGALRRIDSDIRHAAALDGLGWWQTCWRVDWPLVRPLTMVLVIGGVAQSFALYDLVVSMTGGGPDGATESITMRVMFTAWEAFDFGKGAAITTGAVLLEAIVIAAIWGWGRWRRA